ncbi:peptidase, partial [Candidatus Roizmanbacteria bacterium CG_4_9_14_0_8_um_filter_34_12]
AYIQESVADSPAEKAGIKSEDIIMKIDGKKVTDESGGLAKIIADKKIGDKLSIEIWRNGETITLTAVIGEYDQNQ